MKRVDRQYTRRPSLLSQRRHERAAGLVHSAGRAERAAMDVLERRQLLFALTVTADDVDPNTGLGTVTAYFGYVPQRMGLLQQLQDVQAPQQRTEDFNDEGPAPAALASGRLFAQSNIQVVHNMIAGVGALIAANPADTANPPQDLQLRFDPRSTGDFFQFHLFNSGDNPTTYVPAADVTFQISGDGAADLSGIFADQTVVTLTLGQFNPQVVATYTGAQIRNAITGGNPLQGTGTFRFGSAPGQRNILFDSIKIQLSAGVSSGVTAFRLDNLAFDELTSSRFGGNIVSDEGVMVSMTGPIGASAVVFDLYGRDMRQTIQLPPPPNVQQPLVDLNDDGIPDFNDGIGSIHFQNTDSRTAFTMIGGKITAAQQRPADADFWDGAYAFKLTDSLNGQFGDLETAGIGTFAVLAQGQAAPTYHGLPDGPGSFIVGSAWVRSLADYNPEGFAREIPNPPIVRNGFNRTDQGLFVDGGASIGSLYIHGMVMGNSVFSGAVDRLYVAAPMGSFTVKGDLGEFVSGTDAGMWVPEPGTNAGFQLPTVVDTGGQLTVERTLGQFLSGGRSLMDVTVVGDLNAPTTRPPRDSYTYYENEFVLGIDPQTQITTQGIWRRIRDEGANTAGHSASDLFRAGDQMMIFATGPFRNDQIMGAEFINSASSGARIVGELGGRDTINGEDAADVYAFAADGTQDVVFDVTGAVGLVRIVDNDGRTLAAPQLASWGQARARFNQQFRWRPEAPGEYYLVLTDAGGADTGFGNGAYSIAVSGLAPVTVGAIRTSGGMGYDTFAPTVTLLNGSLGAMRIGTAIVGTDGAEGSPLQAYNTNEDIDNSLVFKGVTLSVPGDVFEIMAGSDLGLGTNAPNGRANLSFTIGGNLGELVTGQSEAVGRGPTEGDVDRLILNVAGSIGRIDIRGGIGMDHDSQTDPLGPVANPDDVSISTGSAGVHGDIGMITVASHVVGDVVNVRTSPGSSVGAFLIDTDPGQYQIAVNTLIGGQQGNIRSGIYGGTRAIPFSSGLGSQIKFVDIPRLDLTNAVTVRTPILGDQSVELVDDGGARVRFSIEGGAAGTLLGRIVALPIDGSQGVSIGLVQVDLSGGAVLHIDSSGTGGAVGIGRILVTGSTAQSRIQLGGGARIDVYRIDSAGALFEIINSTGGDLVSVDVGGLTNLNIENGGNLGTTAMPSWGPKRVGVELGVEAGLQGQAGGTLGFVATSIDNDFQGGTNTYRPINDDNNNSGHAFLDDIGGPMDWLLNGLVVRGGDVTDVSVAGSVGDVILQGDNATLTSLRANFDGLTPQDGFDGVVGTIYAGNLGDIDVGDGLAGSLTSPLARAGIFAANDIQHVGSSKASGAVIAGVVNAVNVDAATIPVSLVQGLAEIGLDSGLFKDAFVGSTQIDGWWNSQLYGDDNVYTGDVGAFNGNASDFFRSALHAANLQTFTLGGGFFDASVIAVIGDAQTIAFQGARNSTLLGSDLELRENKIQTGGNLQSLTAIGDMEDLVVDVTGSATGGITAANIVRSSLDVDNIVQNISVTGDIRASQVTAGQVQSIAAGRNIVASTLAVSGEVASITAGSQIANTTIEITGPDGSLDNLQAATLISGSISASGPIGTVTVATGDLIGSITTTTARGNVGTLRAGRDIDLATDISGNVASLSAGRSFGVAGRKRAMLVRGDLSSATATTGQLYNDIRVGGKISGAVSVGRSVSVPGNNALGTGSVVAFGRIASVTSAGDFGGDIISYSGGIGSVTITNGSLMKGRLVAAYGGDVESLVITNGDLLGNVHADIDIRSLRVTGAADGVFGNVGINPARSQFTRYDAYRNQLPVGAEASTALDGPSISAGRNIVSVSVGGSSFEAVYQAGRAVRTIAVTGSMTGDGFSSAYSSAVVAGDSIDAVSVGGALDRAQFIAGGTSLGGDGRPGGTSTSGTDVVKSGTITRVTVGGAATNSQFLAGVLPGADGQYGTGDDRVALGSSTIATLTLGSATNVLAKADSLSSSVAGDARLTRVTDITQAEALVDSGVGVPGSAVTSGQAMSYASGTVTVTYSGPGQVFFNNATGRITLRNTTSASTVTVASSLASVGGLSIVTNDDAALGTLRVTTGISGSGAIIVDGGVGTLDLGAIAGTTRIAIGGDVGTATLASLAGGSLTARAITSLTVTGDFGNANAAIQGEARIQALSGGTFTFRGAMRGTLSVDRDATSVSVLGAIERGDVRVGGNLSTFTAGATNQLVLSVGQNLGTVTLGATTGTSIMAGADLGSDAAVGGLGTATDVVYPGSITSVAVAGNFTSSSITAGFLRGADGFFGTPDDAVAPGTSSIGSVTIAGASVGSTRFSESYRVAAVDSIGSVSIGGQSFTGTRGNFGLETDRGQLLPSPFHPTKIVVDSASGVFSAQIVFDQPVDFASVRAGLSVSEVRSTIDVGIRLIEGVDYTLSYDATDNAVVVTFSRAVSSRNLPQVAGVPGPGVYRFDLDQALVRGKSRGALLDGNADGFSTPGDNYSGFAVIGDAGDKRFAESVTAGTGAAATRVDFYAPASLDLVMDNPAQPDGLADANTTYTIQGVIGDHPDNDSRNFNFNGDTDLYTITLQAGQILNLSGLRGAAVNAPLALVDPNGTIVTNLALNGQGFFGLDTQQGAIPLPAAQSTIAGQLVLATSYLIKLTGVFTIMVGQQATFNTPGTVPDPTLAFDPNTVGAYTLDVQIFQDGDSGFSAATSAGNGKGVVNAPVPSAFAGLDGTLGNADDLGSISVGGYTFTYSKGVDGIAGNADDVVSGLDAAGNTSTYSDGRYVSNVNAAIGPAGHSGVPGDVTSDVDVFQLNNRAPIAAGTVMRVTVKLAGSGGNLGSSQFVGADLAPGTLPVDRRGTAQFGLFETTGSTRLDDATLIFSPSDFLPFGSKPNQVIASNGSTTYGYDANGDFYIQFVTPDSTVNPGQAGSFAVYVQGAFNTDYQVEVVTQGTGAISKVTQNFLIETRGGQVSWLEAGGQTTNLGAFSAAAIGFRGSLGNVPADTYILGNVVDKLNALFQSAFGALGGFDVHFSTDPAAFGFQPFSTIYLSSSIDPVTDLFDSFNFGFGAAGANSALISTNPFGFSQHSDPFNANLTDEGAVFVPSFSMLGYTPSLQDANTFVDSLTGAVSRRAGELLGLRLNTDDGAASFDFQASNSPQIGAGLRRNFAFPAASRQLSSPYDSIDNTDFFLGRQDSRSLLDKVLGRI